MSDDCNISTDRESCRLATLAAEEAANKAVERTFFLFGIDIHDSKDIEKFNRSLWFIESMRKAADKGTLAFIIIICGAMAGVFWAGILHKLKG